MLRHFKVAAAAASFFAIIACNPAFAENRVALVIGNSAYRAVTPLPNAQNDARGMAELLNAAGFEVMAAPDQSQDDLRKTIGDFAGKLAEKGPDTVALIFYAGHGIQVDGENFIVPVDVDPKREADVPLQAVRLNDLLNTLNSVPNKMRILMLDACRNNPFPAINQTTGKGLAMVDTKSGAPGTFISYSTSPGAEAEDGSGNNSPYTTALMKVAREPGLPIEEAFKRVRVSVNDATQGRQVPWESSSLTSDFRFFGGTGGGALAGKPVAIRERCTRVRDPFGRRLAARAAGQGSASRLSAGDRRGHARGLPGLRRRVPAGAVHGARAAAGRSPRGDDRLEHRGDRQYGRLVPRLRHPLSWQRPCRDRAKTRGPHPQSLAECECSGDPDAGADCGRNICRRAERDADPGDPAVQRRQRAEHVPVQHSASAAREEEGRHQAAGQAGRHPAADQATDPTAAAARAPAD